MVARKSHFARLIPASSTPRVTEWSCRCDQTQHSCLCTLKMYRIYCSHKGESWARVEVGGVGEGGLFSLDQKDNYSL